MAKEKRTLTAAGIRRLSPAPNGKQIDHFDAAFPGFALRITDKGSKSFVLFTRLLGRQIRLTVGPAQIEDDGPGLSLAEARQTARDWVVMCQKGEDPRLARLQSPDTHDGASKSGAAKATVLKAVEAYEKSHISRLKPRSQLEARRPLNKILLARWADRALPDITKAEIREVLNEMAASGSPVAANRALAGLKAFFGWCVSEDRLSINPCVGIRAPGGDETSRDRILSDIEIRRLWPLMEETDYPFGFLYQMLLVTAQRRDEVANMRWSELSALDQTDPVWTIPASKNKGGRLHEVPLSPTAVRILRALPRIAVKFPEGKPPILSDFVFTTDGIHPVSGFSGGKERLDELTSKEIARVAKEAGQDPQATARWTIHDLRRTAASGMARADIPPHIVSRVLNHSPGKAEGITAVYNRHGYLREKRQALDTWADKLATAIAPLPKEAS